MKISKVQTISVKTFTDKDLICTLQEILFVQRTIVEGDMKIIQSKDMV